MQVALYARVSTTRQAENDLSIPDQLRQLNDWCNVNGHLVVHEYVEPGYPPRTINAHVSGDDPGCNPKPPAFKPSSSTACHDSSETGLSSVFMNESKKERCR